jgi:hypothetical protein
MFEFLILLGGILIGYAVHKRVQIAREMDEEAKEYDSFVVYIEVHDKMYFAYAEDDQFLGQNADLSVLSKELIDKHESVMFRSKDDDVIEQLKKFYSYSKSENTAP